MAEGSLTSAPNAAARQGMLELDPSQLDIGDCGVAGLYWPLPRKHMLVARDAMISAAIEKLRQAKRLDGRAEDIGGSMFAHLAVEFLCLFQAQAVISRARAQGRGVHAPAHTHYFSPIAAARPPKPNPLFPALAAGPSRPTASRAPLRLLRNLFVRDGIWREPYARPDYDQDIIAVSVGGIISEHARRVDRRVVYQGLHTWFRPLESPPAADDLCQRLADAFREAAGAGFAAAGEKLPEFLAAHYRGVALQAAVLSSGHLSRLSRMRLPRRLWVGLLSRPWERMLAYAVRRAGGQVTGHDHGTGEGHIADSVKTLVDFWSCQRYVTFNQFEARALRAGIRLDHLLGDPPEIVALPPAKHPAAHREGSPARRRSGKANTILYVATLYPGETVIIDPLIPDPLAIDWQARVIAHLRGHGFRVLLKPHPDSPTPMPAAFAARLGAEILTKRFEDVIDQGDILLLDYPRSSTFGTALRSDRPIVVADFGIAPFIPEALKMLERRCAIVPGRFGLDNRLDVDWQEFDAALSRSVGLSDSSFVDSFLRWR